VFAFLDARTLTIFHPIQDIAMSTTVAKTATRTAIGPVTKIEYT
jgi:hypothetical protein